MRYLSIDEILLLHEFQISKYGGSEGIRDIRLLESALFRPSTEFYGKELYKDIYEKAGILAIAIIANHPFLDGNKRTGIHAMLSMLEMNNISIKIDPHYLAEIALSLATKKIELEALVKILKDNTISKSR